MYSCKTFTKYLCKLLISIFMLLLSHTQLSAKEIIRWAKYDFAPFFIHSGPFKDQGIGDSIYQQIQQKLPQYLHRNHLSNTARISREYKAGTTICSGAFKRRRTANIFYFSNTSALLPGHRLHFLTDSSDDMLITLSLPAQHTSVRQLSLETLLSEQPSFKVGLLRDRQYAPKIQQVLTKYSNQVSYWSAQANNTDVTQMLLLNRVNATIEFPFVNAYSLQKSLSTKAIYSVKLQESPEYFNAYIGCSKTPLGAVIIKQINHILPSLYRTQAYRTAIERWIPKALLSDFRREYQQFIDN